MKRIILSGVGIRPRDAIAEKNGRIIETRAPDANITARLPRLTLAREARSIFKVRMGMRDATDPAKGIFSLEIEDLPRK